MRNKIFHILFFYLISFCISVVYPASSDSSAVSGDISPLSASTQMILIITGNWKDTIGTLHRYERNKLGGKWKQVGDEYKITVGRAGLAWGKGLHGTALDEGPVKHEGDYKAPAGVFKLSKVFGYEPPDSADWLHMPYIHLDSCTECVDDINSRYYNTIIDNRKVAHKDWNSSEIMKLSDNEYKWGVFIEHNSMPRLKGGGSCIFLHIWDKTEGATAGCSAMTEEHIINILKWININSNPVLVQLPKQEYGKFKAKWGLPASMVIQ